MAATTVVVGTTDQKTFEERFAHAWVNISHFVRAGDYKVVQIENLRNFIFRGAAVQCHPTQEAIDCVAPVIFADNLQEIIYSSSVGVLQVQTKNRLVSRSLVVSTSQTRPEFTADDRPTFTILIEYGDVGDVTESNCAEITHASTPNTRNAGFRAQSNNYQLTVRGLEAFRLNEEEKTDVRSLLDLTSTLEAFPRALHENNVALMRRLKPDFKGSENFGEWAAVECWE